MAAVDSAVEKKTEAGPETLQLSQAEAQASEAEQLEQKALPEPAAAEEVDTVNCAKCKCAVPKVDCIERPRNREEFRWCCKACNALLVQCQRKGFSLQNLLGEEALVRFFSDAAEERRQATENRVSFGAARALLKRCMVEESKRVQQDGHGGSYQPLSFYELRGYDCDAIKEHAPRESHPILGDTYLVKLHHTSDDTYYTEAEQRLTRLEADALQKKQAAPALGVPLLDLPEAAEPKEAKAGKGKRVLTEEEKEESKRQRLAQKKQEVNRKVATSAAAKLLPALKTAQAKLAEKLQKMGSSVADLPDANKEQVEAAQEALEKHILCGTKLLDCAAKGKSVDADAVVFNKEKDLQQVVKDGNAALRAVHEYLRAQNAQKENMQPKKAKTAK